LIVAETHGAPEDRLIHAEIKPLGVVLADRGRAGEKRVVVGDVDRRLEDSDILIRGVFRFSDKLFNRTFGEG